MTARVLEPRANEENGLVQAGFKDRNLAHCFIGDSSLATAAGLRVGISDSSGPTPLLSQSNVRKIIPLFEALSDTGQAGNSVLRFKDINEIPGEVQCKGDQLVIGLTKTYDGQPLIPTITIGQTQAALLLPLLRRFSETGTIAKERP